jgi:hypothetical protein
MNHDKYQDWKSPVTTYPSDWRAPKPPAHRGIRAALSAMKSRLRRAG